MTEENSSHEESAAEDSENEMKEWSSGQETWNAPLYI